ncbi:hypothetical protein [Sphingomonas sp.]|uniref:hypothetical protein n=1 Tax=Sphingomonas sp. TaxID=28214 RepID=UPI0035C7DAE1
MESWVDESDARGAEGGRVRRSGALRLAWDLPDDAQVQHLLAMLEARLADPELSSRQLEAIIMLLLIMQSGREAKNWYDAILSIVGTFDNVRTMPEGIALHGKEALLILRDISADEPNSILVPALSALARAAARAAATMPMGGKLFASSSDLLTEEIARLLRLQGAFAKATGGDSALRRWLLRRLRDTSRGDPAFASIVAPESRTVAKTISAYYAVDAQSAWSSFSKAVAPLRGLSVNTLPAALTTARHGNRHCPNDTSLRKAVSHLRWMLQQPAIDPRLRGTPTSDAPAPLGPLPIARSRHIAMMIYTFALVSFGTGQRGQQSLPDTNMIDPETGFAWVEEKGRIGEGHDGERGVFHSPLVRQQIAQYERYLDRLASRFDGVDDVAARAVREIIARPGLQFVDFQDGKIIRLNHSTLHTEAKAHCDWPFQPGSGRKWLRSNLGGMVPSDAIAAQFGHHHDGFSVWSRYSGLRPDKVGASLKKAIDPLIQAVGFEAIGGKDIRVPHKVADLPDFDLFPDNKRRAQAGRILASAMWHGGLLNPDQQFAVPAAATAVVKARKTPDWLDLDRTSYASQQRWFIDPETRARLDEQRRRGFTDLNVNVDIDEALFDYFRFLNPRPPGPTSDKATRAEITSFRAAVDRRWRFKLPPILYAAAKAQLSNHSLRAETFDPAMDRPTPAPDKRPRRRAYERRDSYAELKHFLKRCWPGRKTTATSKKIARTQAATIVEQPFYHRMSPLERSLAHALIGSLNAKRGLSPPGDHMEIVLRRAGRLWQHFVPRDFARWEHQPFDLLSVDEIFQHLPERAPWRGDVASDLATLLIDVGAHDKASETIKRLRRTDRSHIASCLRAHEYATLSQSASEEVAVAAMLSYRAGLRIGELRWIGSSDADLHEHHGVTTLSINHSHYRRLKTDESRRHIPLQLLLTPEEMKRFERANRSPELIASVTELESAYDPALVNALRAVTSVKFNFFPLRHSFATNIYAAVLWPDEGDTSLHRFFDPLLIARRRKLRRHLCSDDSLGATAPHAIALLMGHTHPWRALFNYVHNLEVVLAAHVRSVTRVPKQQVAAVGAALAA